MYYSPNSRGLPPRSASLLRDILQDTGLLIEGVSDFLATPGTADLNTVDGQLAKHDSDEPLFIA